MAKILKQFQKKIWYGRYPSSNYVVEIKIGEKLIHRLTGAPMIFIKSTPKGYNFFCECKSGLYWTNGHYYTEQFLKKYPRKKAHVYVRLGQTLVNKLEQYYNVEVVK